MDFDSVRPGATDAGAVSELVWSVHLPSTYAGIEMSSADELTVSGSQLDTLELGPYTLETQGQSDPFFARLDTDGNVEMAVSRGAAGNEFSSGHAAYPTGDIVLTGAFFGDADYGDGSMQSLDATTGDGVVAYYDRYGQALWSYEVGIASESGKSAGASAVAVTNSHAFVFGVYSAAAVLTGEGIAPADFSHFSSGEASQYENMFLLRILLTGELKNAISYPRIASQRAQDIVSNSLDDVFLSAVFTDTLSLSNGVQEPEPETLVTTGDVDGVIARIGGQAAVEQQVQLAGSGRIETIKLASSGTGEVYAVVMFRDELILPGDHTIDGGADFDLVLFKLNRELEYQWSSVFSGIGDDWVRDVALGPNGTIAVAGSFVGELALGDSVFTAEDSDSFVAVFDGDGGLLWARAAGGPGIDSTFSVAFDSNGYLYCATSFQVSADFGDGTIEATGTSDTAIVKYRVPALFD